MKTKSKKKPEWRIAVPADLLTIKEVGAFLRISRTTVNSYIGQGKLVVVKLSARSVRITADSVAALIGAEKVRQ